VGCSGTHCGDEKQEKSVRQYKLRCDYIRKFNGIHNLGIITDSRDAVNRCSSCEFSHFSSPQEVIKAWSQADTKQKVYDQLSSKWDYLNIWWNDADFAIILAFLTVGDDITAECARLLIRLAQLRSADVLRPRDQACQTNVNAGAGIFAGSTALIMVTGGTAAPLVLMLGSWGWFFGSDVVHKKLKDGENSRYKRRRQSCHELQARFPQIQKLLLESNNS
jgi:hypothetical protein